MIMLKDLVILKIMTKTFLVMMQEKVLQPLFQLKYQNLNLKDKRKLSLEIQK